MKKGYLLGIFLFATISCVFSQTSDSMIHKLFQDSYHVIKSMRKELLKLVLIPPSTSLNIENLPKGIYFFSILYGEGKRDVKKFIKQ